VVKAKAKAKKVWRGVRGEQEKLPFSFSESQTVSMTEVAFYPAPFGIKYSQNDVVTFFKTFYVRFWYFIMNWTPKFWDHDFFRIFEVF